MNALEKCVDMLVAIGILFLIPLLFYSGGSRILQSVSARAACENFLRRICTAGEITLPVWSELEYALERNGWIEFGVRREYALWEPGEESGSVTEQHYFEDTSQLAKRIRETGAVELHKGDRIRVICYINDFPTVCYDVVRSEGNIN